MIARDLLQSCRRFLRIMSVALAVLSLLVWIALGANRGWTKTSVTTWVKDQVTGLDGPVIKERFVPGLDLLGAAGLGALLLCGISFLIPKTKTQPA